MWLLDTVFLMINSSPYLARSGDIGTVHPPPCRLEIYTRSGQNLARRRRKKWFFWTPKIAISKWETVILGSQNRIRAKVHSPLCLAEIDSKGG